MLRVLVLAAVSLMVVARVGCVAQRSWHRAKGYEYEWVAGALASGHGYAFDRNTAWLGPYEAELEYVPTAWVEPLYTLVAAGCYRALGSRARLVLVLLNTVWLAGTAVLVHLCCQRLTESSTAATLATATFAAGVLWRPDVVLYTGNLSLACLLFMCCLRLLIRIIDEEPTAGASVNLGVAIGFANLTHAGSLLFSSCCACVILARWGVRRWAGVVPRDRRSAPANHCHAAVDCAELYRI